MKIVLLSNQKFVPPMVGGVDVYTHRLGKIFQQQGHTVQVIALDPGVEAADRQFAIIDDTVDGFSVSRLQFSFEQRPKQYFDTSYDPDMETAVAGLLQKLRPDLFVVVNFYMVTLAVVKAAKAQGIPVFHIATDFLPVCCRGTMIRWNGRSCDVGESIKNCSQCFVSGKAPGRISAWALGQFSEATLLKMAGDGHYSWPNPLAAFNPYWRQIETMRQRLEIIQPLRDLIDHVFVPTRFTGRMFIENGFHQEQVHYLPFGVDPENQLSQIAHSSAEHIRFLFVGRFQPYKGVHLLLEAFNNLINPHGATLTLYGAPDGHGAYYDRVKQLITQNDRVDFRGKIDPSELALAFVDADYFLLPSTWHENSPLIVSDALQSHTPVIGSDIGGITDLVQHDVNGLLFPMGDVAALQATLQRTIDQPALVQKLRAGVALNSIEQYANDMLRFFHEKVVR